MFRKVKKINCIYFHIGSHKTGTSSIQRMLKINKDELEKQGYIFHIPHPWPLKKTPDLKDYGLNVDAFSSLSQIECENVIISHENYSWIENEKKLKKLYRVLKKYATNVVCILYLRRQDALVISQKQEGTKWSDCSTAYGHEISPFPSQLTYAAERYLDFYHRVKLWKDAFEGNVNVRIFEPEKLFNHDLYQDFFVFNLKVTGYNRLVTPSRRVNVSLTRKKQLFLHMIREYFPEYSDMKELITQMVAHVIQIDDSDKLMPSKAEAEAFYSQFLESNRLLDEQYSDDDYQLTFSNDFSHYPDKNNWNELDTSEVIEIFSQVFKVLSPTLKSAKNNHNLQKHVNLFRDSALALEESNLLLAFRLMELAKMLRPEGPLIRRKFQEYRSKLEE